MGIVGFGVVSVKGRI